MQATAKDLRFRSGELLKTVARGEDVLITFRGKVCAKLVAAGAAKPVGKPAGHSPGFGIWKDRDDMKDAQAWVRELRKARF
jgi:prevent-host-death family protein